MHRYDTRDPAQNFDLNSILLAPSTIPIHLYTLGYDGYALGENVFDRICHRPS